MRNSRRQMIRIHKKVRLCPGKFRHIRNEKLMKQIKLSGREQAVLRAIDYTSGSTGEEIQERTQIDGSDLADVLNGMCDVGFVEVYPPADLITFANCATSRFEINPSYAQQLKVALRRE